MSKKHHMTKHEYNSQNKHRRQIQYRHDVEDDMVRENHISHGRIRERNLIHSTHQIRSMKDLEEYSIDIVDDDEDVSA